MKAKNRLARLFVLFSVLPAIVITTILSAYHIISNRMIVIDKISAAAGLSISNVSAFFEDIKSDITLLDELIAPVYYLENHIPPTDSDSAPLSLSPAQETTLPRSTLISWAQRTPSVNRVSLLDNKNRIVLSSEAELEGQQSTIEEKYLARLNRGEYIVTRLFNDEFYNDALSFSIAKPVIKNEEYLGCLTMSVNADSLQVFLENSNLFNTGIIQIIDVGNRVAASSTGILNDSDPTQITINQQLNTHIEPSGTFNYLTDEGQHRMAHYARMTDIGWTVVFSTSTNEFLGSFWQNMIMAFIICFAFGAMLFAMLQIIKRALISPLTQLLNYMHQMDGGDYTSRIPYLGYNEFSEIASSFNNMMTKIASDNRELAIKEERYRIANEQSNNIIFEYNVETNGFTCSPNACELAGYPAFVHGFPDSFIDQKVINSEDSLQFMRLLGAMIHGRRTGAMELHLRTYRDEYHWFALSMTTIIDSTTFKPLRVVGKLTDIDEEKKMTANLTFKAERDPLTSIYNKSTTQSMITQKLSEREQELYYALIVLDIDDFKHVNDGYGHQKGDSVLMGVASALLSQLRSEDVVGRIGGDEFMLMLSAMPSREAIATKATHLLDALRTIPLDEAGGVYLTVSMGIALCPQDGSSFNQLYASADNALYVRKNAGKNGFSFYRERGANT